MRFVIVGHDRAELIVMRYFCVSKTNTERILMPYNAVRAVIGIEYKYIVGGKELYSNSIHIIK